MSLNKDLSTSIKQECQSCLIVSYAIIAPTGRSELSKYL